MARFGSDHDGGYLLCANLMGEVLSAYSYGIDGRDSWGCAVSRRFGLPVHQYDCFNTTQPSCPGGSFVFHPECIGATAETIDGRVFDSLSNQISANGDDAKSLVVKIDVEGAEWDALLATPASVLSRIDQLVIEFHGVQEERYVDLVKKLNTQFYVVNLHFNNYSCSEGIEPFPAWAFEVVFVNQRIAERDENGVPPPISHPLDTPNTLDQADCQT